ncbi:uncharacterized protein T551_03711, partial [Pneumocystis jirovecii RU7]
HSLARAVARAVKRRAQQVVKSVYDDEDYLLALILKEDAMVELQCKERLKKYCENLEEVDKKLNKIYPKLKDICEDKDKKCTSLKTKITGKCQTHKTTLNPIVLKALEENYDCKEHERQCLFLEGACPSVLIEDCNKLRNLCYQRKRDEVAEEVLLRALHGDLENTTECEKKIKNVCQKIGQESDELTMLCLDQKKTCVNLVKKGKSKCSTLEKEVEGTIKNNDKQRETCLLLLEQCYFYRRNCKGDKLKCDELGKKCQEQNIVYIPPGPDFDPTRPEATVAEDIELEDFYKKAAKDGVLIRRFTLRETTALLALLIQDSSATGSDNKEKCKKALEKKCKTLQEHEPLKSLCKGSGLSDDGTKKCEELQNDIDKTCKIFTSKVINSRLFDPTKGNNGILGWGGLPTFLSNEECARLESYCFYYKEACPDGKKACVNVRAACYKRGLDARANKVLQENMRGLLHGSNETWLKKFQQELVKVCEKLKEENKGSFSNDELFVLCVQPTKAARLLTHDHQMRVIFLRQQLDQKRDFPTNKDCKELGRKCQDLGKDSNQIQWPCHTLKQQCDRLGTTEILKQVLLDEHKDTLRTHENCVTYLKEKCNKWSRRGDDRFTFVCVFQNATCELMVKDVQDRCEVFKENIQTSEIVEFLKNNKNEIRRLERNCSSWYPYCNRFSPNCPDLTKGDTCAKIKEHCEPFYERKALEDALKVELRGKLNKKNKCTTALKGYCTQLGKLNNESIKNLCKDSTQGNNKNAEDKMVEELCKKLVEEVEQQCKVLPVELTVLEKSLEKDVKTYKELKKEAKKAMEKSNLVLSLVKKNESNVPKNNSENNNENKTTPSKRQDTTEHVKILRRGIKDVSVTELEVEAFDLTANVFGRYVDLKERCKKLTSDCGIKDDCKEIKDVCEKIQGVCSKLEPLKVKPHEIKTVTETNITTVTETVKEAEKTVGDGEKCKSLSTTDTWVTHTSTHTSTSTTTSTVTSRITLTSTRRCKPTKCTTGDDPEDVKPSEGLRMNGWSIMKGVLLAMMISVMI